MTGGVLCCSRLRLAQAHPPRPISLPRKFGRVPGGSGARLGVCALRRLVCCRPPASAPNFRAFDKLLGCLGVLGGCRVGPVLGKKSVNSFAWSAVDRLACPIAAFGLLFPFFAFWVGTRWVRCSAWNLCTHSPGVPLTACVCPKNSLWQLARPALGRL
jgi:hypothetical protein